MDTTYQDDDDKYLEPPVSTPTPGVAETAAVHGIQGLTMGFSDELGGVGAVIGDKLAAGTNWIERNILGRDVGEVKSGPVADVYREGRGEVRKQLDETAAANPKTAIASQLAGNVVTSIAAAPVSGASRLGRVGLAAAESGLAGLGSSEADVTKGDVAGAARDTALGAAIGAVIPAAAGGAAALQSRRQANKAVKEAIKALETAKTSKAAPPKIDVTPRPGETGKEYAARIRKLKKAASDVDSVNQYYRKEGAGSAPKHQPYPGESAADFRKRVVEEAGKLPKKPETSIDIVKREVRDAAGRVAVGGAVGALTGSGQGIEGTLRDAAVMGAVGLGTRAVKNPKTLDTIAKASRFVTKPAASVASSAVSVPAETPVPDENPEYSDDDAKYLR